MRKNAVTRLTVIITALLICGGIIILLAGRFCKPVACPFLSLTGFPCPGCGISRALYRLLQLDFSGAWKSNPLCFLLPFLLFFILFGGTPFKSKKINTAYTAFLAVSAAAFYIIRL